MFRQILSLSALALTAAPMIALNSSMASATPSIQARALTAQTQVNGRSVNYVKHSANGYYINHGNGIWFEGNAGNPTTFKFQEVQRDEWSVYLLDRSRNVRIQLDLHRKKVIYSAQGKRFDLYNIISAQSEMMINGGNVNYVSHTKGFFANKGNGTWVEADQQSTVKFTFKEMQRDEWSVYLLDQSRNVRIQLDLHRKKVIYSDSGRRFDLYNISEVGTKAPRLSVEQKQLTWINASNGNVPRHSVIGGQEPGRRLYICRASYKGGVHPGKVVAQNCNISYGGREIEMRQYQTLVNPAKMALQWTEASNGGVPRQAILGGQEPGRELFVCRASYKGGIHPGKVVAQNCNIGYGGREIEMPRYQVLVRR